MSADYMPGAGVVAAYVVAFLHSLPMGTEVDTGTIAQACDTSIPNIISGTGAAVSHGLIFREKVGARYLWRRGPTQVPDSLIAAHPPKAKVSIDPTLRATLEAAAAAAPPPPYKPPAYKPPAVTTPAPAPVSLAERFAMPRIIGSDDVAPVRILTGPEAAAVALGVVPPAPAPIPEPPIARTRRTADPVTPLRAGIWSDGSLHIQREGRTETYSPDEVTYLVRFLDRMLLRNGAVA